MGITSVPNPKFSHMLLDERGEGTSNLSPCPRMFYLRVILVQVAVLLVVQPLGVLLGMMLGLLAVDKVEPLGLGQLVDLGAGKGGDHLLGEAVVDGLALLALLVLEQVHGLEGGGAAQQLVRQLALPLRLAVVHLVASLPSVVWSDSWLARVCCRF